LGIHLPTQPYLSFRSGECNSLAGCERLYYWQKI